MTDLEEPAPGAGELLVEVDSAGVNYADTHQAEDSYLVPQTLPFVPGSEVVGRVVSGDGPFEPGTRVLGLTLAGGGYAERAVVPAGLAFRLKDDLSDAQALALLVHGTTAWHLLRRSAKVRQGESVVVHSAAGGVGSMAVQLARAWGAGRIVATASGEAKCELARSLGAEVAVDVSATTTADEVRQALLEANAGQGLDVVLEMTGGHVFDGSLAALRPLGRIAVFGMASKVAPEPVLVQRLMRRSLTLTGFWLPHAVRQPGVLEGALEELRSMVRAGVLRPVVGGSFPLADAARAHEELRSRRSTGKLVLDVSGKGVG
ncbi:zinc-binding dehydrogenase [Kineosporia sp. J2-2]|uniref:Zinc-binding dehydrogenase n=1 Tax=Kineosporia corallincola TaxID=2835133 RepID=A0ABS5TMT6_9ACTN|nr:zinc-binding dehydrogenase [Kineosporia corallincola]MBT0772401.1 zinc-binding dehydrogenase [Kineosporia corallincola]